MCYDRRMKGRLKLQAVVLTGARDIHNPLLVDTNLRSKVLLPVGGEPMLASVLKAIHQSRHDVTLHVSSNDPDVLNLDCGIPFEKLPSESGAVQSMLKSLERVPGQGWVLFVSGDHPLLTADMVDYFIEEVVQRQLTFAVAVVDRATVQQHHPESRRTYFPVKNGAVSGGNLFLINKAEFAGRVEFMETIDSNRKKPWMSLFKMANPWTIIRFLFRQMTIHDVALEAVKIFRCNVGVVEMPFAECCMDVDKPSDRELAEAILRQRQTLAQIDPQAYPKISMPAS